MIPQALKGLLSSEKAFAGGFLVIAATVFVGLNRMTIAEWQEFCTWVFGIYVAGKTTTGVVSTMKTSNGASAVAKEEPTPAEPAKE